MSIILAIESSTDLASVALHPGNGVTGHRVTTGVLSRQVSGVQSHSQSVLPMVQALLAEAGLRLDQCDAIAFGAGPGSFTGVRTACGIAQGLAYGSGLPVVAVGTLEATAQACRDATGADSVLVALDARMGQVYWAHYRWASSLKDSQGQWHPVVAPRLDVPAAVIFSQPATACGNGFIVHAAALAAVGFTLPARPELMPHAAQVATLAQRLLAEGKGIAAREAQPIYLRNDVALTTAERDIKRAQTA